MKVCTKCGRELPESEFYKCRRKNKEYLRGECKQCTYANHYKNNASYTEYQKQYGSSEKRKKYMKMYRASHR